ncbi:MAG: hypothetical protein ABI528_06035 [bacterium]
MFFLLIENRREKMELLFPQYTLDNPAFKQWSPDIVDYFALAFSTSTTFEPTDTLFLFKKTQVSDDNSVAILTNHLTILSTRAVTLIN